MINSFLLSHHLSQLLLNSVIALASTTFFEYDPTYHVSIPASCGTSPSEIPILPSRSCDTLRKERESSHLPSEPRVNSSDTLVISISKGATHSHPRPPPTHISTHSLVHGFLINPRYLASSTNNVIPSAYSYTPTHKPGDGFANTNSLPTFSPSHLASLPKWVFLTNCNPSSSFTALNRSTPRGRIALRSLQVPTTSTASMCTAQSHP